MKPRRFPLFVAAYSALALSSSAFADTLYWDGTDTTADADGGGGTWDSTTPNWDNAATGGADATWNNTTPDSAVFGGGAGTVTLGEAITAAGLIFNTGGYTITGDTLTLAGATPTIATGANDATVNSILTGSAGFTKTGTGVLTLGGTGVNNFTGQLLISDGTVKAGKGSALGAGGSGNETIVQSGATFDVNGQAINNTEIIQIAGVGVGGNGALINSGGQKIDALNNVTLTADATVGGTGRFDIRGGTTPTLNLAGFTLNKVGNNHFGIVGATVSNGNININAGTLAIETGSTVTGTGTITVASTGTLALYGGANITRSITSNGGTIDNLGLAAEISSNITLAAGTTTISGTAGTTLRGTISGTGDLTKSTSNTLTYSGTSIDVSGAFQVTGGRLTFNRTVSTINLNSTNVQLGTNREMVVAYGTGITGGTVTMGSGSLLGLQNGGGAANGFGANIVLASGTGPTNAASIGGFIFGNATTLTGTISGTGDLRWRNGILGGGSNNATLTAANNTSGWAVNSYTGATSFEGTNLTFSLASNINSDVINPFGVSGNDVTQTGGVIRMLTTGGGAGNTSIIENNISFVAGNGQTTTFFREDGNLRLSGKIDIATSGTGKVVLNSKWGTATTKGLDVTGQLTGSGNLTVTRTNDEQGSIHLGNNANTYNGTITVSNSGGASGILVLDANGAATSAKINLASSGAHLNVNTTNATIASLSGVAGSQVSARTAGQTLTVNQAGDTTFAGNIGGTGVTGAVNGLNLAKAGVGSLTLTGTNSYTGTTSVNEGTLIINGNISTSSLTTIAAGATITGNGTTGALSVATGGFVGSGNGPQMLNTGNLNMAGTYQVELGETGYDRLNVTGSATLSGLLQLTASTTPAAGSLFFILINDGSESISGTFFGLAEGSTVTDNLSNQYTITYTGDSATNSFVGGNDIALRTIPEPSIALLSGLGVLALFRRRRA